MLLFQNERYHIRFEISLKERKQVIRLIKCEDSIESIIAEQPYMSDKVYMKITARGQNYNFIMELMKHIKTAFQKMLDGRILSTDVAGGFVGTYIGLYASSNGIKVIIAYFDWFEYKEI